MADDGTSAESRGFISCWMAMPASVAAMRGSGGATVDGGRHGLFDSHSSNDRASGSSANRNDSAVEPVRGRPSPISGASIRSSPMDGSRRNQPSISRRDTSSRSMSIGSTAAPSSFSVASVLIDVTSRSRPSRNASSPKSVSPVRSLAATSSSPS